MVTDCEDVGKKEEYEKTEETKMKSEKTELGVKTKSGRRKQMAIHGNGRERWCCDRFSSICVSFKYAADSNLKGK